MKHRLRSILLPLLAAAIWGMAFVAQDVCAGSVPPLSFNAIRFFIAVVFLSLVKLVSASIKARRREKPRGEAANAENKGGAGGSGFADDAARAAWCLEQCVYANAYTGDLPVTGQTGEGEQRENRLRVLIVSHGVFNAHLIGQLVGFPFDKNMVVSQYNACINRFQLYTVNGVRRIRFRCFNNTSHLPEEMLT